MSVILNKFFVFFIIILIINNNFAIFGVNSERLGDKNENIGLRGVNNHQILRHETCDKSVTLVNGEQVACKGDLIIEEDFNEKIEGDSPDWSFQDQFSLLNSSLWGREVKIPQQPNYEFCVFHKLEKNIKINNGELKIIPTILEDEFGENIVYFGNLQLPDCNGHLRECSRRATSHSILPPIISARLTTKNKFNFRYGKIEIRAKFARGDWLFSEMKLHSIINPNVTINLGMLRGNEHLFTNDELKDFGAKLVEFEADYKFMKMKNSEFWNDEFHVYRTIWTAQEIIFEVDDERVGTIPYSHGKTHGYDENFYLTLSLGIGGVKVFPDGTKSGNYGKPWRNVGAKAMLRFWQAKDQWLPTWRLGTKQTAAFEIDYVKIFAV